MQVQEGAQGAYQQVASAAPLQRVVEYGQAAAAKATEQAQAAYECAPPRRSYWVQGRVELRVVQQQACMSAVKQFVRADASLGCAPSPRFGG